MKMLRMTMRFNAPIPHAKPTPRTAPTNVCVVETGMPILVETTTVVAAERVAAKARLGVSAVMELPTVSITFLPYMSRPVIAPKQPKNIIHAG